MRLSRDWWNRNNVRVSLGVIGAVYCIAYYVSSVRPRLDAIYPLGWYGWADQGEYLRSVAGFAALNFGAELHLYPPLYDLLAAPFFPLFSRHPHFFIDGGLFLLYSYTLLTVSRCFYGTVVPVATLAALMITMPLLTLVQWVIPWTTTLQSGLVAILFLIYHRFECRPNKFLVSSGVDFSLYGAFFLTYGALLPTRPLDVVVFFPFALLFFVKTLAATVVARAGSERVQLIGYHILLATLAGLVFVVFYFSYNYFVFGSIFGRYLDAVGQFHYDVSTIFEKAYSIFWNSDVAYGERNQAFFERVPLIAPAMALCIITAILSNDIRRWIVICSFLQIAIYLPYGDLLPTGVFRYYNLHYFKWTYPWLFIIAVGQGLHWLRCFFTGQGWKPLLAGTGVVLVGALVSLVPGKVGDFPDYRSQATSSMTIDLGREEQISFIELSDVKGGFADEYFGSHTAVLNDTTKLTRADFRIMPRPRGVRLLFSRPTRFRRLLVQFDKGMELKGEQRVAEVYRLKFSIGCRLRACGS